MICSSDDTLNTEVHKYIKINFTFSFHFKKVLLLENLKWLRWVTLGACVIFILNDTGLEPWPAHSRHLNKS